MEIGDHKLLTHVTWPSIHRSFGALSMAIPGRGMTAPLQPGAEGRSKGAAPVVCFTQVVAEKKHGSTEGEWFVRLDKTSPND